MNTLINTFLQKLQTYVYQLLSFIGGVLLGLVINKLVEFLLASLSSFSFVSLFSALTNCDSTHSFSRPTSLNFTTQNQCIIDASHQICSAYLFTTWSSKSTVFTQSETHSSIETYYSKYPNAFPLFCLIAGSVFFFYQIKTNHLLLITNK